MRTHPQAIRRYGLMALVALVLAAALTTVGVTRNVDSADAWEKPQVFVSGVACDGDEIEEGNFKPGSVVTFTVRNVESHYGKASITSKPHLAWSRDELLYSQTASTEVTVPDGEGTFFLKVKLTWYKPNGTVWDAKETTVKVRYKPCPTPPTTQPPTTTTPVPSTTPPTTEPPPTTVPPTTPPTTPEPTVPEPTVPPTVPETTVPPTVPPTDPTVPVPPAPAPPPPPSGTLPETGSSSTVPLAATALFLIAAGALVLCLRGRLSAD